MSLGLDRATLEAALMGYQQRLLQIEAKMTDLRRLLGQAPADRSKRKTAPRKQTHKVSPEGRERIAAAQRARWARVKRGRKAGQ